MANYKVGDLDVTISGISKDAVSSLDEVIKQLDKMLGTLSMVSAGFDYAFRGINSAAIDSISQSFWEVVNGARAATSGASELNNEIKATIATAAASASELNNLADAEKEVDKSAKKAAKGGLSKLLDRIGRITLYSTIRRGLRMITSTFSESVQAYAQVDDNINKTMSQLTSSTKIIKLSLGSMILPIIQAITPAVQSLSVGFANMANTINKSMALAQGNATYTKIDTEALEDYRKQLEKTTGALFDFDKFRALSNKQNSASASSFLITETVSELTEAEKKFSGIYYMIDGIGGLLGSVLDTIDKIGQSPTFQTILTVVGYSVGGLAKAASWLLEILNTSGLLEPVLGGIAGYLTYIGVSKIFLALSGGKLVAWIKAVVDLLKYDASGTIKMLAGDFAKFMSSTKMLAISIGALSGSIIYLIQNWKDMSETGRALTLTLSLVAAAIVGVFTALVAAKWAGLGVGAAIKAGLSAAALTAAIGIAIGTAASTAKSATADIPKYAMGASNIDSGSLFVAGEAGKTEAVYTGDNGKTNVANVQQMAQADYQGTIAALNEWWKTARNDIPQLQPASDTGIYQAAERGAGKVGRKFTNV